MAQKESARKSRNVMNDPAGESDRNVNRPPYEDDDYDLGGRAKSICRRRSWRWASGRLVLGI